MSRLARYIQQIVRVDENLPEDANQEVSRKFLNLWRRYPFESRRLALIRGTIALVAVINLLAFVAYTIMQSWNKGLFYGVRSFHDNNWIPQPYLFTNHCTSAMDPGANLDDFANLIMATPQCQVGSVPPCSPIWLNVSLGLPQEAERFRYFYAEKHTDLCLAFICSFCQYDPLRLPSWKSVLIAHTFPPLVPISGPPIWNTSNTHIGSTAIWFWNNISNLDIGSGGKIPRNVASDVPIVITNGSYLAGEINYSENGVIASHVARDFLGWSKSMTITPNYGIAVEIAAREDDEFVKVGGNPPDGSYVMRQTLWNGWDSHQIHPVTSLPGVVGSLGGLWSAFSGLFAAVFGTSVTFIIAGSRPINVATPILPFGKRIAAQRLDERYLIPGKQIDAETRLRALLSYLADFVVDTGTWNLDEGRIPGLPENCTTSDIESKPSDRHDSTSALPVSNNAADRPGRSNSALPVSLETDEFVNLTPPLAEQSMSRLDGIPSLSWREHPAGSGDFDNGTNLPVHTRRIY